MMQIPTPPGGHHRRNRFLLLAIAGLFFGSMLLAGVLRFSGWRPSGTRAHGELLKTPGDLRAVTPTLADGAPYRWNPASRVWRIALAPPHTCVEACVQLAGQLDTVWQLMGRDAGRVHVLWIGTPPAGVRVDGPLRVLVPTAELRAALPQGAPAPARSMQGVPVYLIDPNGFVVMRYAPGFDPAGLRADLAKLLKLM